MTRLAESNWAVEEEMSGTFEGFKEGEGHAQQVEAFDEREGPGWVVMGHVMREDRLGRKVPMILTVRAFLQLPLSLGN